ncbi:MAG TPA: hypothetical protein VNO24_20240 [Blastocatellia bacterium]|nr:hypothetical protein [Blastocatellia bacterium]
MTIMYIALAAFIVLSLAQRISERSRNYRLAGYSALAKAAVCTFAILYIHHRVVKLGAHERPLMYVVYSFIALMALGYVLIGRILLNKAEQDAQAPKE